MGTQRTCCMHASSLVSVFHFSSVFSLFSLSPSLKYMCTHINIHVYIYIHLHIHKQRVYVYKYTKMHKNACLHLFVLLTGCISDSLFLFFHLLFASRYEGTNNSINLFMATKKSDDGVALLPDGSPRVPSDFLWRVIC